jgi:hypothetical protein
MERSYRGWVSTTLHRGKLEEMRTRLNCITAIAITIWKQSSNPCRLDLHDEGKVTKSMERCRRDAQIYVRVQERRGRITGDGRQGTAGEGRGGGVGPEKLGMACGGRGQADDGRWSARSIERLVRSL